MQANILRIISLAALLFVFNLFFPGQERDKNPANTEIKEELSKIEKLSEEPILISAKTACVFDYLKNEFIFEKETQAQVPLASLTKLMTALTAKEHLLPGTLIEISKEAILQEGNYGFTVGQRWKLPVITNIMLISSSNDAAFAIAESLKDTTGKSDEAFVKLMNSTAQNLGLKQTFFLNPTGLDISKNLAGAYGSCQDITTLMKYLFKKHSDILETTRQESYEINGYYFKNTNKIVHEIPMLLGGKTGFSDLAGGNLTIVVDKGIHHPVIITVLGSTLEGRFTDTEILYEKFVK